MSKDKTSKLCIVGTIPPPVGGVTIHVKRFLDGLKKSDYSNSFIDLRQKNSLFMFGYLKHVFGIREFLVHYQLNKWSEFLFLVCVLRNRKFLYTVHSIRYEELGIIDKISCDICKRIDCVTYIAPTVTTKKRMLELGFPDKSIIVHDTYFPPIQEELDETIPQEIENFILRARKNKSRIVLAGAYKLYLDDCGRDVYGLDMCIEACRRIPELSLIFCTPQYDKKYLDVCCEKITNDGLGDRIHIFTKMVNLASLYSKVDLFVRPTTTDSYGISAHEAIDSGIPVIASDVCERASGVVVFSTGNIDDFCMKINGTKSINNVGQESTNSIDFYVRLYNSQASERK